MSKPAFDIDPKAKTEQPHAGWSRPRTLAERRELIGLPPMEQESSGLGSMSRLAEDFAAGIVPGGARAQPPADTVVIEEPEESEPMRPDESLEERFNAVIATACASSNDPSAGVDPGNKYTSENNKLAYHLLPPYATALAAAGFKYGGVKNAPWNWIPQ